MKRTAIAAVLLSCCAVALLAGLWIRPAIASKVVRAWLPSMDSLSYISDSAVMVRVEDRVLTAEDVRNRYYNLGGGERPTADSSGRSEFLNILADKEVLALVARKANVPLEVEQRADLRRTTETTLQNMLYQVMVVDSIEVTEHEVQRYLPQFSYDVRVRELLFEDRPTATKVRGDLVRGRIGWADAYRRYSMAPDSTGGNLGWIRRVQTNGDLALKLFAVEVGSMSEVVQDQSGYHVVQVLERRPAGGLALLQKRRMVIRDLIASKTTPRMERMYQVARNRAGAVYDSTQLRWVASEFRRDLVMRKVPLGGVIAMNSRIPRFSPEDLKRVLIRDRTRQFTLDQFIEGYKAIPPMIRRKIVSVEALLSYADGMFFAPVFAEMARERGIDKDPRTVKIIEERREKLMVERMFRDSISSKVKDDPKSARQYYDEHRKEFAVKLSVKYAMIIRPGKPGIDSVKAALDAGVKADAIVAADKAAGWTNSMVASHEEGQPNEYGTLLLEELRPGSATMLGPDREGKYMILTVMERQDAREKTFEEAQSEVLERLRAEKADLELQRFLARHRGEFKVETHPERVMAIRFNDPILE